MSPTHGSYDKVETRIPREILIVLRWIPACLALAVVTSLPIQVAARPTNYGRYDTFLYRDWRYPLDARNKAENKFETLDSHGEGLSYTQKPSSLGKIERVVGPTYLCFIGADDEVKKDKVSNRTEARGNVTIPSYVFLSFTAEHYSRTFNNRYLRDVGKHAADRMKVGAYWVSSSCVFDSKEEDREKRRLEKEKAIWTIPDIVRRASAVAIVVPGTVDEQRNEDSLLQWGKRVWTMPELLLYTGNHPILIYEQTKGLDEVREVPRRELWNKVWSDVAYSGQLIDHYENSLTLSPLELVTVALQCFNRRHLTDYADGDMSYALMGLLRHRPDAVTTDTAFQAFARLSLANDSNMLLERLVCLLPNNLDDEWWSLDDVWQVMLWDIYPKVQICGIGEDDTVILDGAHGAVIRWDKFIPVLTLGAETLRHRLSRGIVRGVPGLFFIMLFSVIMNKVIMDKAKHMNRGTRKNDKAFLYVSAVILSFSGILILCSPYLIYLIYRAKVRDSQPLFFGIEGYLDIKKLEFLIFGSYEGRLQWSTASSPLSRHGLDREGMKEDFFKNAGEQPEEIEYLMRKENMYTGFDPVINDSRIAKLVENAKASPPLAKKIFTLVDTHTMSVTLFEAVRPPVAVVICGAEGGMQRALLCSLDWTDGTLYRETVLRMETRVWDRMDTMPRIRLGLKRNDAREAMATPTEFKTVKGAWWKRFAYGLAARIA